MENNSNKTKITRKQLGEIYPNVRRSWQSKINEVLAENRFDDVLEVDNEILLKAYLESYEGHRIWLDSVTGGINNLKPQIELGRWYWVRANSECHKQDALIYVQDLSKECKGNYGFNHVGEWLDGESNGGIGSYAIWNNLYHLNLATDMEVEKALIKEAKRRGYKVGVTAIFGSSRDQRTISSKRFTWESWDDTMALSMGCDVIFRQDTGKWAEIIEKEPKYVWVKTKRKGKLVIEQHPEKQLVNLMSNGWEKLTQTDLEKIKKEL